MEKSSKEARRKIEEAVDSVYQHKRSSKRNIRQVKKKATEVTDHVKRRAKKAIDYKRIKEIEDFDKIKVLEDKLEKINTKAKTQQSFS